MDTPLRVRLGCGHRHRGRRRSRERKQLAPARLDMPIFKSTDVGAEVTYTLWRFDVDAFLEQYDEASMSPHIFASLRWYLGKLACTLDEGKVRDLLMHMDRTFGNKRDYDAMIRTLYGVQQRDDETVEEYMLCIHKVVAVIHWAYPDCLLDRGQDLKDCFYHGLHPYLHNALSFAMAELPKREQAHPTFDTLYTLAKKLEAGQPAHVHQYTPSSEVYRDKHSCYVAPTGQVAALEEEESVPSEQVTGEDSESEVEAVGGINVHLAQAMSQYQREERQCFVCGLLGHFARGCPHREVFRWWHWDQASSKGEGENGSPALGATSSRPEVNVRVIRWVRNPRFGGGMAHCSLARTQNAGRIDRGGQEFYSPSGQWQSGEYNHARSGAAVRVPCPLEDLMDYQVNLVGLGGMRTSPLRFVILRVQVPGVAGYDEDVVFLVVSDESNFGRRVPFVVGTCTISRLINVIHESEIDSLATPWSTMRVAQLLSCQLGTVIPGPEGAETQEEGACGGSPEVNVNEWSRCGRASALGHSKPRS